MKSIKHTLRAFGWLTTAMLLSVFVAACNSEADADTANGVSQAQFNELKTQVTALADTVESLKTSNAALEKQVASLGGGKLDSLYLTVSHPEPASRSTSSADRRTLSVAPQVKDCTWTQAGYPDDASPVGTNQMAVISCGYAFNISAAREGQMANVQPLDGVYVFTGAACTGQMYVAYGVGSLGAYTGAVFTETFGHSAAAAQAHPEEYFMVEAGTIATNVTVVSAYSYASHCDEGDEIHMGIGIKNGHVDAYKVVPNDPSVTGVPNAPIPGPVLPTTLQ